MQKAQAVDSPDGAWPCYVYVIIHTSNVPKTPNAGAIETPSKLKLSSVLLYECKLELIAHISDAKTANIFVPTELS